MGRNYLLFLFLLLSIRSGTLAQNQIPTPTEVLEKKIVALTQQNTALKTQVRQGNAEKQQLQAQSIGFQKTILTRNDSIASQQKTIDELSQQIGDLNKEAERLESVIAQRNAQLKTANTKISALEYDKKNLIDNKIVRIYNFSANDVRKQFLQSLSKPESGFQYDDALVDDEIQITRNFNDQAEAWWVFDKTLDTILELKIRIKPHLYDPQKSIVFGETKLLQKTRYSNKPFEPQHDQEKISLYREKAFRLLEGKLQGTSDK